MFLDSFAIVVNSLGIQMSEHTDDAPHLENHTECVNRCYHNFSVGGRLLCSPLYFKTPSRPTPRALPTKTESNCANLKPAKLHSRQLEE